MTELHVFNEIKNYLNNCEENIKWGVADNSGSDYGNEYKSALVLAQKHTRWIGLECYDEQEFEECLRETRTKSEEKIAKIKEILDNHGIKNIVPPSAQTDEKMLLAPFSFKYAAVKAGIGWMGKNDLLVTKVFGPRIMLRAILAAHPFEANSKLHKNLCGGCTQCIKACPEGFVKGTNWHILAERSDMIDYQGCNTYRSGFKSELGRKHSCGLCMLACPYGK